MRQKNQKLIVQDKYIYLQKRVAMKFQKISALLVCCLFMQSVSASSKKYEKDATSPSSSYGDFASLAEDHDARKKNEGQGGYNKFL